MKECNINKFDVWCTEMNEWEHHSTFISIDGRLWHYNLYSMMQLRPENHKIIWHIGIKDLAGMELKVGDVVKRRSGEIYIVRFNQQHAKFQIERVQDKYPVDFMELASYDEKLQIMGNICENPELPEQLLNELNL